MKDPIIKRIRRIRGQIEGIERMLTEDRYCIDIITQIRAATSALKSLDSELLKRHLENCVRQSLAEGNPRHVDNQVHELIDLIQGR